MWDINDELTASRTKSCKHSDLKQHLAFGLIPATCRRGSVDELLFVFLVPGFIECATGVGNAKGAGAGLQGFAELNASVLRGDLGLTTLRPVDDVFA